MNKYIEAIAAREGRDPMEIYTDIQSAINSAWEHTSKSTVRTQQGLMGNREVPSVDELIAAIQKRIELYRA